jgi:hypothetical protein
VIASSGGLKKRKLARSDAGILTHPLFGDRDHWYDQHVTPGWFTRPCEDAAPRVRQEVIDALDNVAANAASKGA